MKKINQKLLLTAYVLVVALFFAAGYGAGRINGRSSMKEQLALQATSAPEAVDASAPGESEETEYRLVLENGTLMVYENGEGERRTLAACEISESVYPNDDIAALKSGMSFSDKNAAMAMFENFAS